MTEIKKLKKEITGKTESGIEYKVKKLEFNDSDSILFGTMEIKRKEEPFLFDFTNSGETEYHFEKDKVEDKFEEALGDFYENHITEYVKNKIKKHFDDMVIERIINIH